MCLDLFFIADLLHLRYFAQCYRTVSTYRGTGQTGRSDESGWANGAPIAFCARMTRQTL